VEIVSLIIITGKGLVVKGLPEFFELFSTAALLGSFSPLL
jgi:hypothetical protein